VEKWKAKGRLPTFPLLFLFLFQTSNAKTKEAWQAELRSTSRLILQLENV